MTFFEVFTVIVSIGYTYVVIIMTGFNSKNQLKKPYVNALGRKFDLGVK